MLMQALAASKIEKMQSLTIRYQFGWFEDGREENCAALLAFIARQSQLKLLDLFCNFFSEEREQEIREAVSGSECRVILTDVQVWRDMTGH